jgi:predicted nucleic acid-binding protein
VTIVIDTSALVAVLLSEPERPILIKATRGADLVAPSSVNWEVGNALTAALERQRVTLSDAQRALTAYGAIPIRFLDVDLALSVEVAAEHQLCAYDAYLIVCASQQRTPLLTLDAALGRAAAAAGVTLHPATP